MSATKARPIRGGERRADRRLHPRAMRLAMGTPREAPGTWSTTGVLVPRALDQHSAAAAARSRTSMPGDARPAGRGHAAGLPRLHDHHEEPLWSANVRLDQTPHRGEGARHPDRRRPARGRCAARTSRCAHEEEPTRAGPTWAPRTGRRWGGRRTTRTGRSRPRTRGRRRCHPTAGLRRHPHPARLRSAPPSASAAPTSVPHFAPHVGVPQHGLAALPTAPDARTSGRST